MVLLPSSVTIGICEEASLHWKTPYSKPQGVVTFSERKLWQTQRCISKGIKMRVDTGHICFESGSPGMFDKHQQLYTFSLNRHPANSICLPSFYKTLGVCPGPGHMMEGFALLFAM